MLHPVRFQSIHPLLNELNKEQKKNEAPSFLVDRQQRNNKPSHFRDLVQSRDWHHIFLEIQAQPRLLFYIYR